MRFAPFAPLLAALALVASPTSARAGFEPIFADGFETGDTLRWSTETGDPSAPDLPPDPESVAPPLDLTVATSTAEALEFLWTAKDPAGARRAGENLYDYVGSVPTALVDPNGLWPKKTDKGRGRGGDDFWKWTHEDDKVPGDLDYGEDEIKDLIDIWEEEGRPDPKKRRPKRGRVREIQACEVSPAELAASLPSLPAAPTEALETAESPDLGPMLVAAGAAIIVGTIVEDVVTGGVGLWNDPVMIQFGGALVMKGLQ